MRKLRKFAKGGRADAMRDRRMADIEKDYKIALAKGKSEKEARAKREQRIADAKDDYAKRTGADRSATRAAEKAAEARLTAARRSPDKDVKSVSVASESSKPLETAKVSVTEMVKTPKVGGGYDDMSFSAAFRQAMKDKGRGETFTWKGKSYKLETAGSAPKAAPRAASTPTRVAPTSTRAASAATKQGLTSEQYTRALNTGVIPGNASAEDRENLRLTIKAQQDAKYSRPMASSDTPAKPAQGYRPGSSKPAQSRGYAKGGSVRSVDGIAKRGKTRAPMKKGK